MADRPILFSAPMVRALLDGRKTQTRRIIKPQPDSIVEGEIPRALRISTGDRLWVRESGIRSKLAATDQQPGLFRHDVPASTDQGSYWVESTRREGAAYSVAGCSRKAALIGGKACPSIHMPRWASRLTLIVEGVKVERLQDISQVDAIAEGIAPHHSGWMPYSTIFYEADGVTPANYHPDPRESYRSLWNVINGFGAWEANPWVVAYTFRAIKGNIDQIAHPHPCINCGVSRAKEASDV